MEAIKSDKLYTYSDYLKWDDDVRRELIDGVIYLMAPSPTEAHQDALFELGRQFGNYLLGKQCKAIIAPFDVRLNADKGDYTVVQPDLIVVCDKSKLDGKSCNGAPDLVIEILSPSTGKYDKLTKLNKYLGAGVREYWIVDPIHNYVSVFILEDGKYNETIYGDTDTIPVHILEDCNIELTHVFANHDSDE